MVQGVALAWSLLMDKMTRAGVIYLTEQLHFTRNNVHCFRPLKKKLCDLCLKNPKKMITFNHLLAKSRPVLFKELADE